MSAEQMTGGVFLALGALFVVAFVFRLGWLTAGDVYLRILKRS